MVKTDKLYFRYFDIATELAEPPGLTQEKISKESNSLNT